MSAILHNTLRERVASWAHRNHPGELRDNVRRYLGKPPATEADARAALAFALVTAPMGGASLIDRFVAQVGHLPRAERKLFDAWARARFALLRTVDVEPGAWIDGHDVLSGRTLHILERSGSEQIEPGMWLAAFVYEADGGWAFEGSLSIVMPVTRIAAVQAAIQGYASLGIDPREAAPAATRQVANAAYDAMHRAGRPPRFVTADGDDIELVTSVVGAGWEEVCGVVLGWPDALDEGDRLSLHGLTPTPYAGGTLVRATFQLEGGEVSLFTNSRARHDEVLARWHAATGAPLPVRSESVSQVPSNRDGSPVIAETSTVHGSADQSPAQVEAELNASMNASWPDEAIPALDGLTPREAVARGRRAEVWALASGIDDELWPAAEALLRE